MKKPSSKSSVHSRFVPGEEIDTAQPWEFGAVSSLPLRGFRSPEREAASAAKQKLTLEQERAAGYEKGLQDGYARAATEVKQQMDDFYQRQAKLAAQRMAECVQGFEARWAAAEQDVAQGVLELGCAVARQVVRRELHQDPHALEAVIREAVSMLGSDAVRAVVRLNPEDFGLMDKALQATFADVDLVFRADASVAPAGCVVESGGMSVDGALDKRWSRAVGALGLTVHWDDARPETGDA